MNKSALDAVCPSSVLLELSNSFSSVFELAVTKSPSTAGGFLAEVLPFPLFFSVLLSEGKSISKTPVRLANLVPLPELSLSFSFKCFRCVGVGKSSNAVLMIPWPLGNSLLSRRAFISALRVAVMNMEKFSRIFVN